MSERSDVVIERDVEMRTRDGVVLRSDVYRPAQAGRHPVLLARTCYGKSSWGAWIEPERTAAEGWVVVINDTRGGFASEGEFNPFFHDAEDGYDVVEWCAEQEWCSGRVGMFGSSAPGFVQLLAATERPPHLTAIAPMQTWTSHGRGCVYDPGGGFMLYTAQWALQAAVLDPERLLGAGTPGYEERLAAARAAHDDPGSWYGDLPLDGLAALPRPWFDFFHRWLEHTEHDEFWAPLDLERRFAEIDVPALHLVGLFDKFRVGSTYNYGALRDGAGSALARANQRIVIGPWTHGIPVGTKGSDYDFPAEADVDVRALLLRWYGHWLKGDDDGLLREPPVRVWVQGADRWREAADWPLPEAVATTLHLRSDGGANGSGGNGRLAADAPGADELSDHWISDPADPDRAGHADDPLGGPDRRAGDRAAAGRARLHRRAAGRGDGGDRRGRRAPVGGDERGRRRLGRHARRRGAGRQRAACDRGHGASALSRRPRAAGAGRTGRGDRVRDCPAADLQRVRGRPSDPRRRRLDELPAVRPQPRARHCRRRRADRLCR
jgi:putative CocE/NonD family hydrolase